MSKLIRAVISTRYSSNKQNETSTEAQLFACREYAKRKNYVIVKVYIDEGETGRFADRSDYQQMIADAKQKLFDVVIFHKLDRNSRNEYDYYHYKGQLRKNKIKIEYAEQNFDETPEGMILENMMVGLAAYYSRNLARETMKVMNVKALKAEFTGGKPPFGYNVVNKHFVINEHEAVAVKMIFDMFLSSAGYGEISDWLTLNGYKTRRGENFGKNSLHDLLKNEKYIGTYVFNKVQRDIDGNRMGTINEDKVIKMENAIPAIIEKETFERVKEIMNARKNAGKRYQENTIKYLLSGLMYCSECKCKMIGTKAKNGQYLYYRCNKKERHAGKCATPMVPKETIEEIVIDEIYQRLLRPEALPILIKELQEQSGQLSAEDTEEIKQLEKQEKDILRKIDNLYELIEDGEADDMDKQRLKGHKEKLTYVKGKLAFLRQRIKNVSVDEKVIAAVINDWSDAVKEKDPDRVQAMLKNFVDKVVINPDHTAKIHLKIVCLALVPRTGIEPVRKFLSDGF